MAKILDEKEVNSILNETKRRIWITQEMGDVKVLFKSELYKVEKGEEDLGGMTWTQDFPLIQAEAEINGVNYYLGIPISLLEILKFQLGLKQMTIKDIKNTEWRIKKVGRYDWEVEFLGKHRNSEESQNSSKSNEITPEDILSDLKDLTEKLHTNRIKESIALSTVCVKRRKKVVEIREIFNELINLGLIKKEEDELIIE